MSRPIGAAGRGALTLARERAGARRLRPEVSAAPPAIQAAAEPATGEAAAPAAEAAGTAAGWEMPSAEEVAERVYRLFCRDLRWERERYGGRPSRLSGRGRKERR